MELIPLQRAYKVDEAINTREGHLVIVRFGRDRDDNEKKAVEEVDGYLKALPEKTNAKVYTVLMKSVPELVARYKLMDPITILFFRNNIQVGRLHWNQKDEIQKTVTSLLQDGDQKSSRNKKPAVAAPAAATTTSTTTSVPATVIEDDFASFFRKYFARRKLSGN